MPRSSHSNKKAKHGSLIWTLAGIIFLGTIAIFVLSFSSLLSVEYDPSIKQIQEKKVSKIPNMLAMVTLPVLDKDDYDRRMILVANNASTTASTTKTLWPVKAVYPKAGAILPFKRIVAYYGNFYSKGMGVLGEYPEGEMLSKLKQEVAVWNTADPKTPVVPAIHYIATTAQESAGREGLYMLRMPDNQIDHALELAAKIDGLVFLDIQVGLSNLKHELPLLEKYLKMPNVHLGLDPEFSMKTGARPGTAIGTMDATDINYAATYLSKLVQENNLPPKILVIHRFTQDMLTNYQQISPLPEVQIVVDMDGWGFAAKKINTYNQVVYKEPIQFTGFKLFYKNDLKPPSTRMLSPAEILKLTPQPLYIQYQ